MNTRLEKFYKDTVVPQLMKEFGYDNVMQVPRISKISLNMGVGEAVGNKKILENAVADMAKIAGQKPVTTKARVSVASFKIRDGWPIGCKVTLRRAKMYEFLDRLINVSLPRVRDFRGVSGRSFDGRGNFNMGVRNRSSSRKLISTPSTRCAAWTSPSPRPPRPTRKPRRCSRPSASRSATKSQDAPWPRPP
jgi:large subunit ribosomal protein L5